MPRAIPTSGFFDPQRRLGVLGRKAVSALDATTGGQAVVKHARRAMNFKGRGMARGSDLNNLTGPGVGRMRSAQGMRNRTRVDINDMNNPRARMRQLRATAYDPRGQARGRYGTTGLPGSSLNYEDSQYVLRNRNRRMFGYGAGAAGLGIANSATNNNRGSYRGPGPRIQTPKGVGRNA
jgi:hypothetical protein